MRFPEHTDVATLPPPSLGSLLFDDGSQKGLSGFTVWCCMAALQDQLTKDDYDTMSQVLIASLEVIPTVFKSKATLSRAENLIANIAKQDMDSRTQPITSFLWSSILLQLNGGSAMDEPTLSYTEAIAKYNMHPDIQSVKSGGGHDLSIDNRKQQCIRNWYQGTCSAARAIVEKSQHTLPFTLGPWGETLSSFNFIFMGSKSTLQADSSTGLSALDGEATVGLDWSLCLGEEGQTMLFEYIVSRFNADTAVVPLDKKKKYRLQPDSLWQVRNACALFEQIKPFLLTKMSGDEVADLKAQVQSHAGCCDLQFITTQRPGTFAISMLPEVSTQKQETKSQQAKVLELESKRAEVQQSMWSFFKDALKADQSTLATAAKAPQKINEMKHLKAVEWRRKQEATAQEAVQGYCDSYLKITDTATTADCVKEVSDFCREIVPRLDCFRCFEDASHCFPFSILFLYQRGSSFLFERF